MKVPLRKALAFIGLMLLVGLLAGAATQLDLGSQVKGVLPTANGGTGQNSTAVFPGSGTIMTTTTAVAAAQLPAPTGSTLGGVESNTTCTYGIASITTSGTVTCNSAPAATVFNQGAPTGTINGSNTSFTLSPTPGAASNINCFQNGLQLQQGSGNDYTVSGANLTWLTAPPTGAKIDCLWY